LVDFDPKHFFDQFNEFYKTSKTGSFPNRLNNRYLTLIDKNKHIIENSSILDLGSHDGRWSFASLKNNAYKVLGIEANPELVKNCITNMEKYGISKDRYSFVVGDIFQKIKEIKTKTIDVVFCFGVFYHILNHMQLLSEIKRLEPRYLFMDTRIDSSQFPIIRLKVENSFKESTGIETSNDHTVLAGIPSKLALELMLTDFGFEISYYDWAKSGINNWQHLEDYQKNIRISVVAKNTGI